MEYYTVTVAKVLSSAWRAAFQSKAASKDKTKSASGPTGATAAG